MKIQYSKNGSPFIVIDPERKVNIIFCSSIEHKKGFKFVAISGFVYRIIDLQKNKKKKSEDEARYIEAREHVGYATDCYFTLEGGIGKDIFTLIPKKIYNKIRTAVISLLDEGYLHRDKLPELQKLLDSENVTPTAPKPEKILEKLIKARPKKLKMEQPKKPKKISVPSLQDAIIAVLEDCPNLTCTYDSIATRVLRRLKIDIRGQKRAEFQRSIEGNIKLLKKNNIIEEYKAKNRRLRLIQKPKKSKSKQWTPEEVTKLTKKLNLE